MGKILSVKVYQRRDFAMKLSTLNLADKYTMSAVFYGPI